MTSAVNKPVNTYVFPELPYYSKEWLPVLEAAKLTLVQEDYLCHAVIEAVSMCETQHEGTAWHELGDEITAAIDDSLGRNITVSTWYWVTFGKSISKHKTYSKKLKDYKVYRLAWIDHIIMKCKGD